MTPKLGTRIQTLLLISSVLIVSACATTNPKETITNKTDETASITIEKGKSETPPAPSQPVAAPKATEPVKTVSQAKNDAAQAAKTTRINPKERSVNVRTSSSVKSRLAAVLEGGQTIEVLEARRGWLKIKWQNGDAVKQGWINKSFVEGYE